MKAPIACIAPNLRLARAAASDIAPRVSGAVLWPSSIAGYLAGKPAPRRIVLCAAGDNLEEDLEFLRRAARRVLWPAPPSDFGDAIGGLRTQDARPRRVAGARAIDHATGLAAALLLEGIVGPDRVRAALQSSAPRHWIVESARHVRLPESLRLSLDRAGVRWSALDPVEVVALYAAPALARRRKAWKALLPPKTEVWVRGF